jgi:hypothetical protein
MNEELSEREQAVEDGVAVLLLRMGELRDFAMPGTDEDPREVHRLLREELRPRLDEAETLMAQAARFRRRARRALARANAAFDDAFDAEMSKLAVKAMRLEFQSVHDRLAMARVAASSLKRAAREAERVSDLVDEAEEVMRGMYFGLRDIRKEILVYLEKYLPWESSLER